MDDRLHAPQGVAEGGRVGEVAEGDLDPHPLGPEAPWIAHQAAHVGAFGEQPTQQRRAHQAGGAGKQEHASYNMPPPQEALNHRATDKGSEWPT